jgi:L-ribulose-5-phosphate 3-epimerase
MNTNRREFLVECAGLVAGAAVGLPRGASAQEGGYRLALGQWSFHNALQSKRMDTLEFPGIAREMGFEGIDFVNQFFKEHVGDREVLGRIRKEMDQAGVTGVAILVDGEGRIGDPDEGARGQAVENHKRWVDAAKTLGCSMVRVNAESEGSPDEQRDRCAAGIRRLCEHAASVDADVLVENHGGLSSNAEWLVALVKAVDHPRCGTLPDFGNWDLGNGERYDAYKGIELLMPQAKLVSVKSHDFDEQGNETSIDYARMLKIVRDSGYRGWLEIEYEGPRLGEAEGIKAAKTLVERTLAQL